MSRSWTAEVESALAAAATLLVGMSLAQAPMTTTRIATGFSLPVYVTSAPDAADPPLRGVVHDGAPRGRAWVVHVKGPHDPAP